MTFEEFERTNIKRARRWLDPENWSPAIWGTEAANEIRECCKAIKKLHRLDNKLPQTQVEDDREELIQNIETRIGNTVIYLDLLAQRLERRLEDCVRDTFNRASQQERFPERLR